MKYIVMLRGINVGGHRKIRMADLRTLLNKQPFTGVRTYIQSGNIVLDSSERIEIRVARTVSGVIRDHYGFDATAIVRKPAKVDALVQNNPFSRTDRLYVTFLESPPKKKDARLSNADFSPEACVLRNRDILFHSPAGYGKTKMSNNFFEDRLNVRGTTRNWNTVLALLQMSAS